MKTHPVQGKVTFIAVIIALIVIAFVVYRFVAVSSIDSIKNTEHVGKKVSVRGEVTNVLKIGELSSYTLKDDTGTIAISSEKLPQEGDHVRVSGVLIKDTLFGYYIKVD